MFQGNRQKTDSDDLISEITSVSVDGSHQKPTLIKKQGHRPTSRWEECRGIRGHILT